MNRIGCSCDSRRFSRCVVVSVLLIAAVGCEAGDDRRSSGAVSSASGSGEGGSIVPDDASTGGAYYDGPEYDGASDCAPEAGPKTLTSCCEGVPCQGACELHDGLWQCTCFGVIDGCGPLGLVCCLQKSGCTNKGACDTVAP